MWPTAIKAEALVACGRRCCICHEFCGTNIECHHIVPESAGGRATLENCIPLCFDCHAEAGHYNVRHPKGTKYSATELRGHRDTWFKTMSELSHVEQIHPRELALPSEIYEGQAVQFCGFVWREAFPGPPNYASLETDEKEVCWMLILPRPITLIASSFEDDSSYSVPGVKRLQMMHTTRQYTKNQHLVLRNAIVSGRLFPSHTGHHHGDALIEVNSIEQATELVAGPCVQ